MFHAFKPSLSNTSMAGPELRKPSEELLMLRPSLQSELAALSHRYGIDLKPVEAGQLVDRELPKLKASTPPEIRERMEKALLDYMKTANPSRATTLYNQMQGAKFWDALDIENATIMLGIHKTTVKSALDSCAALPAAQKQAMLESVIAAIAESYRIRGEDHVNEFGVRYDANSSDPSRVISEHTFNCISGSISLGQIVSYAAGRVGLPSCVKPYLQTVASFTKNGVRWEDAGHAILRLDFLDPAGKTTKTVYYDAANDLVPMQHDAFKYNAKDNTLGPADALAGPVEYRLGTVIPIGQILDGEAATQDRLLGGNMGADAIEKMYKLPPVFISYLAANLSKERQAEFFMNYSFETMQSLQQPAMRFRIAAMAAGALAGEDEKKSLACAALAIKSLSEAYSSKATYHQLPMGGFLQTTMDLIAVLKTAPRGDEIIASSPLFAYVPYIASTVAFPDPKLAPVAAKARDFLVELYESNQEDMARLANLVLPGAGFAQLLGREHGRVAEGPGFDILPGRDEARRSVDPAEEQRQESVPGRRSRRHPEILQVGIHTREEPAVHRRTLLQRHFRHKGSGPGNHHGQRAGPGQCERGLHPVQRPVAAGQHHSARGAFLRSREARTRRPPCLERREIAEEALLIPGSRRPAVVLVPELSDVGVDVRESRRPEQSRQELRLESRAHNFRSRGIEGDSHGPVGKERKRKEQHGQLLIPCPRPVKGLAEGGELRGRKD